jgi:hypothetical protein
MEPHMTLRHALPLLLAGACAIALAGCDSGLELDSTEIETPGVGLRDAPVPCNGSTGVTDLTFDPTQTRITVGNPSLTPENAAHVIGTVSGLSPSDSVFLVSVDEEFDCPLYRVTPATVTGGTFEATVDLGDLQALRIFAVAAPVTAAEITCTASDCVQVGSVTPSGVSQSLVILL